jgi:hypothetical protein
MDSAEYRTWTSIKARCLNPNNKKYHLYGGRGIQICDAWKSDYAKFLEDVGRKPTPKHSIDRYPNKDGHYEPDNVRWATPVQQARNMSRNRMITIGEETKCLAEWLERYELRNTSFKKRVRNGMSLVDAITKPKQPGIKHQYPPGK